jgi:hypothetical protein
MKSRFFFAYFIFTLSLGDNSIILSQNGSSIISKCINSIDKENKPKSSIGNLIENVDKSEYSNSGYNPKMEFVPIKKAPEELDVDELLEKTDSSFKVGNIVIFFLILLLIVVAIVFAVTYFKKSRANTFLTNSSKQKIELKDIATELEKINELKIKGVITDEEFLKLKERIIK